MQISDMGASDAYAINVFLIHAYPILLWITIESVFSDVCKIFSDKIEDFDEMEAIGDMVKKEFDAAGSKAEEHVAEERKDVSCSESKEEKTLENTKSIPLGDSNKEETEESRIEKIFGISEEKLRGKYQGKASNIWNVVCDFLVDDNLVEECIGRIESLASQKDYVATQNNNTELLESVVRRVGLEMKDEMSPIFYVDNAAISRGKEGILFTSDNAYFLSKKKIDIVEFSQLISIKKNPLASQWYFNDNFDTTVGSVNVSDEVCAMLIAYMLVLSYRNNLERKVIVG